MEQNENKGETESLEVTVTLQLPEQLLSDIMVTAFDGNYGACWTWCSPGIKEGDTIVVEVKDGEDVWKSVDITVDDLDGNGEKQSEGDHYRVDWKTLHAGIIALMDKSDNWAEEKDLVTQAIVENDAGEIDAILADVIVQFGLFGEMQYS